MFAICKSEIKKAGGLIPCHIKYMAWANGTNYILPEMNLEECLSGVIQLIMCVLCLECVLNVSCLITCDQNFWLSQSPSRSSLNVFWGHIRMHSTNHIYLHPWLFVQVIWVIGSHFTLVLSTCDQITWNTLYGYAVCERLFRFFPPTFAGGEEAVHVDAAAWVWDRQGAAGHESLLRGWALCGSHQTPARSIARALQHLHRLSWVHTQLTRRTRHKVLQHHCVFTTTREL